MIKKTFISLCTASALLLGASCTPQEQPGGAVSVILSSGQPETRGAAEVADGSEIYMNNGDPDLILLLFNSEGTLVAKYPDSGSELMDSPTPSGSDLTVRITKTIGGDTLPGGEYTVYAIANTAGLWALTDGDETNISAGELSSSSITTQTQAEALYFSTLYPSTLGNGRLPLTAKTSLTVSEHGNGSAQLELKRCVAQVVVKLVNNYTKQLSLSNLSVTLRDLNASTGYLFPHNPDIPAGIVYADLVKEVSTVTLPDNTVAANEVYEFSSLAFPGAAPQGTYACDISFGVSQVGESTLTPTRNFSFTGLPVHNNKGQDITNLTRNQRLTITVTINQGQMLSFSFEVGEWTAKTETVTFD